ncbi:alpha/beta fold hydrolase [Flavobacterium sp. HSC-61S13]|uniref:alpha/beta hydrolase family protein n=1 Tax=Flavobacterium sp. HSC-61S13 TaxID=2910963 RepID=UPI00209FA6BA|nr:alpha/beta fold hydrolase [Flavobacterium sp. HSC-61S13]MCP1994284.1 putative alpha/beta hydrolase [Flavobacterium sp. HSC-61S13]
MERIRVKTLKSHQITVHFFESEQPIDEVVIIVSATGVRQQYYGYFADYLAENGFHVFCFDYTGIGESTSTPLREVKTTAVEWASNDLECVIQYAEQRFPQHKTHLIGHSIGGQIMGFAPSAVRISNILLVASQSGYWGLWKGFSRYGYWAIWNMVIPISLKIFGYLPSKRLMGMENLPKTMAKQWSDWCRHKNYFVETTDENQRYHHQIKSALFSFSLEGDNFAPPKAVDWLAAQYSSAEVRRIHLHPKDFNIKKIGHFDVFRSHSEPNIWPVLLNSLKNT